MRQYSSLLYLFFAILSGILIDVCFLFEMPGISVVIFMVTSLVLYEVARYVHKEKLAVTKYHLLALPILFFASVFAWRTDSLVLFLAGASLLILSFFYFVLINNPTFFQKYSLLEVIELKLKALAAPFTTIVEVLRRLFGRNQREQYKALAKPVLKIFLGCAIAFPIFAVVLLLLYSADDIFAQFVRDIVPDISWAKVFTFVLALFLGAIIWFYVSGLVESKLLNKSDFKIQFIDRVFKESIIPIIIISALNVLYVVFAVFQFRYFFGGEQFVKDHDLVYSEYAVKGFWEMIIVILINYGVLYVLQTRFSLKSGLAKALLIPSYLVTILASLTMVYSDSIVSK